MKKHKSTSGGTRNYRVKKSSIEKIERLNHFEKHLVQEGIKQVVLAQGTEQFISNDDHCYNQVPKEMIQFLLDYDMIEEYNYVD
jgi:ribosome biogenesis protein Tsr3